MHDNIVQYLRRHKSKETVEIEVAFAAAAAPTSMLSTDRNLTIGNTSRVISLYAFMDRPKSRFFVCIVFLKRHHNFLTRRCIMEIEVTNY